MKNLDDESFIGKTDYYIFCINDYIVVELPRRVDDGDSQTKKKYSLFIFGNFYCTVVPTISNPLLRMLMAAFRSRS